MRIRSLFRSAGLTLLSIVIAAGRAGAQAVPPPAAPSGPWIGSIGGGVALTSGNTDTSTINASYDVTYDPKTKNVVKSDALYLRGKKLSDTANLVEQLSGLWKPSDAGAVDLRHRVDRQRDDEESGKG